MSITTENEKAARSAVKAAATIVRMTNRLRWATAAAAIAPMRSGPDRADWLERLRAMVGEGAPVQLLADQSGITRATLNRLLGKATAGPVDSALIAAKGEMPEVEAEAELVAVGSGNGFW